MIIVFFTKFSYIDYIFNKYPINPQKNYDPEVLGCHIEWNLVRVENYL